MMTSYGDIFNFLIFHGFGTQRFGCRISAEYNTVYCIQYLAIHFDSNLR